MNKLLTRITTHHAILPRQQAHSRRSKDIYTVIACLLGLMILLACSCSPAKNGCEQLYKKRENRKFVAWFKCVETGKVTIMNKEGEIICSFMDKDQ